VPEPTLIHGQLSLQESPGAGDSGDPGPAVSTPANSGGDSALPPPLPAIDQAGATRRDTPVCCWVAVGSSLTSVVLAILLWVRPPAAAPPALAHPPPAAVAVPAPATKPALAPGSREAFQAALQPYLDAAQAGDTNAMRMLGTMYYHGLDLPRNREEGLKWYRKAADSGSKVAQEELKQLE
jgi:hypothetical protein